jgi:hypothetical protein
MSENLSHPNLGDSVSNPKEPVVPARGKGSKLKSGLVLVGFLLLPFLGVALVWKDRCKRGELQSVASPSGEFTAQQFRVDCGPSMSVATEVRLSKVKDSKLEENSTVLVLPSDELLDIKWVDGKTLTIQLPGRQSQVVRYRREWAGVNVGLIGDIVSSVPKDLESMFN